MNILLSSPPEVQGRILQGILDRYPVGSSDLRTPEMAEEIKCWMSRLHGAAPVETPSLRITSEVVARALRNAEHLLGTQGAASAVDRELAREHERYRRYSETGLAHAD